MNNSLREARAYDEQFYRYHSEGASRSARLVVDVLLQAMPVQSVIDVGCGAGNWLAAFIEKGIDDVAGYDGEHVDVNKLLIPRDKFQAWNLEMRLDVPRRYDLAICLEVGEHLPKGSAHVLVDSLAASSDVVAFSAALPGQGGTNHVNEQCPSYWSELFAARGYRVHDWIRPAIWNDSRISWWYRQNLMLYCAPAALSRHPSLDRGSLWTSVAPLPLVHPDAFDALRRRISAPSVQEALGSLARSVGRAFIRRVWARDSNHG